jgi:hypothetical protein
MEKTIDILEPLETTLIDRRQLLPWWIKVFCWIFMVFGIAAFACLVIGVMGYKTSLALYGFETNDALSLTGLLIISVAILKGFTAFSLWFKKNHAITLGKIDAILGIVLCTVSMVILPFVSGSHFVFRLELALLIPYFIKLNKIQGDWGS